MILTDLSRAVVLLLTLCVCGATVAFAQTSPRGMPLGLFGRDDSHSETHTRSASVLASVATGQDDDLGAAQGNPSSEQRVGGPFSDLNAAMFFDRKDKHLDLTGHATGLLTRYPSLDGALGSSYSADTDLNVILGRRTSFGTSAYGNYVSSLAFNTFSRQPGLDMTAASDTASVVSAIDSVQTSYGASTRLHRTISRHSTLGVTYNVRFSEQPVTGRSGNEQMVTAALDRTVGRSSGVGLAYTWRGGTQDVADVRWPYWSHDVQASFQKRWQHAARQHTVLNVTGGPSFLQQQQVSNVLLGQPAALTDSSEDLLRLVGSVTLIHEMSPVWSLEGSYRRGAGLLEAVVFSNTASVSLRGSMGRRVDFNLAGGYTDGEIELRLDRNNTSFGSTRLQVALSRLVAVYGQYYLYHYDFGSTATQPAGAPPRVDRGGVRVGVTVWAPIR